MEHQHEGDGHAGVFHGNHEKANGQKQGNEREHFVLFLFRHALSLKQRRYIILIHGQVGEPRVKSFGSPRKTRRRQNQKGRRGEQRQIHTDQPDSRKKKAKNHKYYFQLSSPLTNTVQDSLQEGNSLQRSGRKSSPPHGSETRCRTPRRRRLNKSTRRKHPEEFPLADP